MLPGQGGYHAAAIREPETSEPPGLQRVATSLTRVQQPARVARQPPEPGLAGTRACPKVASSMPLSSRGLRLPLMSMPLPSWGARLPLVSMLLPSRGLQLLLVSMLPPWRELRLSLEASRAPPGLTLVSPMHAMAPVTPAAMVVLMTPAHSSHPQRRSQRGHPSAMYALSCPA